MENTVNDLKCRIASVNFQFDAEEKETISKCNLCEAQKFFVISHKDRYGFNAKTMICTHCGLGFLNPRMTSNAYSSFYAATYRPLVSAYHGRLIDAKSVQVDQKKYANELMELLQPHLNGKNYHTFLDVGGSTGILAVEMKRSFNLHGTIIDPAPDEVDEANNLGIEAITSFIEDWDSSGRKFDVIGMFQTIDHLLDIKSTLKKLREVINEDGLFIVDIVDFRYAYLKNWSINLATKIDHPYYLTENTMEMYLALADFDVIKKAVSADNHLIFYVCKPAKITKKKKSRENQAVKDLLQEIRFVQSTPWKKQA